jgi:hypothetical protein
MRSVASAIAGCTLLLLASCTDQPVEPTGPSSSAVAIDSVAAANAIIPAGCPTVGQVAIQIAKLVKGHGPLLIAEARYALVVVALAKNDQAKARRLMLNLLDFILEKYTAGQLIEGQSATTQSRLKTLAEGLYCIVGLPPPTLPLEALGDDGAAAVISPGDPQTTLVTETGFSGAQIPANAVTTPVLLVITRLPDNSFPLLTQLQQYPAFYEIHTSPPTALNLNAIVGFCQVQDFDEATSGRLRVAHNVGTGIEILPRETAGFLTQENCNTIIGALDRGDGIFNYVMRGFGRVADKVLLPQYAYASTVGNCCLGGSTRTFSPFGAVDPYFDWEATGWSWKLLGTDGSPPSAATINTAVGSLTGYSGPVQGAFSKADPLGNTQCSAYSSLSSRIHTRNFDENNVIAFRRDFVFPDSVTSGTMSFAVDNDFRVFVNGVDKTPSVVFTYGASGTSSGQQESGFRNHDGCPARGDFTLALSGLSLVSNTVVVVALDRGGSTYFDASVTPAAP